MYTKRLQVLASFLFLSLFAISQEAELAAGNKAYKEKKYTVAFENWMEAGRKGSGEAMNNIGDLYFFGHGVTQSYSDATRWWLKAAEKGHATAIDNIADTYFYGQGVDINFPEALKWYLKAASAGSADAMNSIGEIYYDGKGVKKDVATSLSWYQKSAALGHTEAMLNIGRMYDYGDKSKANQEQAFSWYKKSATAGNMSAMRELGAIYYGGYAVGGKSTNPNYSEAINWYKKASEAGDDASLLVIGEMYSAGGYGITPDFNQSLSWYKKALPTDKGGEAANKIALLYYNGTGIAKDMKEARRWFATAADKGSLVAMYNLGFSYYYGTDPAEYSIGVYWLKKAAEKGHEKAMYYVGEAYYDGIGVTKSYTASLPWFFKAVDHGNYEAMSKIGLMYLGDQGLPRDDARAHTWIKKSASGGNSTGMFYLGMLYEYGRGVKLNQKEALKWYVKAWESGSSLAKQRIDEIEQAFPSGLSTSQKADLERADLLYHSRKDQEAVAIYQKHESVLKEYQVERLAIYYSYYAKSPQYNTAVKYYKRAAESGSVSAMLALTRLYGEGKHISKDAGEAFRWLQKAASLEDAYAIAALGDAYYKGEGVQQDKNLALTYWKKADGLKEGVAAYELGEHYELTGNYSEAAAWYDKGLSADGSFRAGRMHDHKNPSGVWLHNPALQSYLTAIDRGLTGDSLKVATEKVKYYSKLREYIKKPAAPKELRGSIEMPIVSFVHFYAGSKDGLMLPLPALRGGTVRKLYSGREDSSHLQNTYYKFKSSIPFTDPYILESHNVVTGEKHKLFGAYISQGLSEQEGKQVFEDWATNIQAAFPESAFTKTAKSLKGTVTHSGKKVVLHVNLADIKGLYFIELLVKDSDRVRTQ